MKNNITFKTAGLAVLFAGMLLLSSCDTVSTSNDDPTGAFTVPKGFNFQTTTDVTLNVRAAELDAQQAVIRIYDAHPFLGGNVIRETPIALGQNRTLNLNIGGHLRENLWVLSTLPSGATSVHKVEMAGNAAQVTVRTFNNVDGDEGEENAVARGFVPAPNFTEASSQGQTYLNAIGSGIFNDFEEGNRTAYQLLCWGFISTTVNGSNPINGQWNMRSSQLSNPSDPNVLSTPWIEFNGTGTVDFSHRLAANNSSNVTMALFYTDSFGNPVTSSPLYTYTYSNTSGLQEVSVNIPAELTGVRKLVWVFVGNGGNSRVQLDDIFVSGMYASDPDNNCEPVPSQGNQTEFVNHYPGENVFGTLAFEDNWPGFGDYDMNDLVLGYNIREITNANNEVIRIEMTHQIRAIGGVLRTGFGYQFPFAPTAIQSVSGQRLNNGLVTNTANGTEAGQDSAVVILWDNSTDAMPTFSNVIPGRFTEYDVIETTITFTSPISRNQVGNAPYNPFIFIHGIRNGQPFGGRGHEVHLKGMPPTSLADQTLFGDASDITNPANGVFYTSREGLNWAIHIPVPFVYPRSQVAIYDAYTNYKEWARSGGTAFPDWYLDIADNLDESKVYRRP